MAKTEQLIGIPEAAKMVGTIRQRIYEAINRGEISTVKIGSYIYVLPSEIKRYQKTLNGNGKAKR